MSSGMRSSTTTTVSVLVVFVLWALLPPDDVALHPAREGATTMLLSRNDIESSWPSSSSNQRRRQGGLLLFAEAATSRYIPVQVGGQAQFDEFGVFLYWYVSAEERAAINPPPEYELRDVFNGQVLQLQPTVLPPNPPRKRLVQRLGKRRTVTKSLSETWTKRIQGPRASRTLPVERRSIVTWHVLSHPFGALGVEGPKSWYPTIKNRIVLSKLKFSTAGAYNVRFNVSLYDRSHIFFNTTFFVKRQPDVLVHGKPAEAYNGSQWFPTPGGTLQDFLGATVKTNTAMIRIVFESTPPGAVLSGTLELPSTDLGSVSFQNVFASLPGPYTYRLVALLSDGLQLQTPSQVIVVQRALPTRIVAYTSPGGIARFNFYRQPLFSIVDQLGPSRDTRMNMSLHIASGSPSLVYDGQNTEASILGQSTIAQGDDYFFRFQDIAIDYPGSFQLEARMVLPTGATLSYFFNIEIQAAPTFEVVDRMTVNTIGQLTLFGARPKVSEVKIRLSTQLDCSTVTSDVYTWQSFQPGPVTNLSVVPFVETDQYVCMSLPSHPTFSPLVVNYLPQFDEAYPLVYTFGVRGVSSCVPLAPSEAERYRKAGWKEATALRAYGCRLRPPVSGTIPPCACRGVLSCEEHRHPLFQPPMLDIGMCVCCTTWVMALAGIFASAVGLFIIYIIIAHV